MTLDQLLAQQEVRDGKLPYIKEIREKAMQLGWHFDRKYPHKLLEVVRPSEQAWMKEYRESVWESTTLESTGRIFTALTKIQQSDDWRITFNEKHGDTGIPENDSLAKYLTTDLPKYVNLQTWLFGIALKTYLRDSNAVVLTLPDISQWIEDQTSVDFKNPYPQVYGSDQIIYKDQFAIIFKLKPYQKPGSTKDWDRFLAVEKGVVSLWKQVKEYTKEDPAPFEVYPLVLPVDIYPVTNIGSILDKEMEGVIIYDSPIWSCIPAFNKAARRDDDLNVIWALHAHPQKWQYQVTKCKTCKGRGTTPYIKKGIEEWRTCGDCNGTCTEAQSPFSVLEINPQKSNAANPDVAMIPSPPAGYVQLDTESLDKFKQDIKDHKRSGYQAIGLELLCEVPEAESGVAKEYDRQEINVFFYGVADQLKSIYTKIATICYDFRYNANITSFNIPSEKQKNALPTIVVPTNFDVLTTSILAEDLAKARDKKFSPAIIQGLEIEYTEKLYGEKSRQLLYFKAINFLDPFPYMNVDDKIASQDTGGTLALNYVLSTNLPAYVNRLIEDQEDWLFKDLKDQRVDVMALAQADLTEIKKNQVVLMPTIGA